jgi:hypothetical protein
MESPNEEENAQITGSLDQNRHHADELLSSDPDETERLGKPNERRKKLGDQVEEKPYAGPRTSVETGEF